METLGTFGFRGEALSSLCALCNLTIVTRHSSSVVATRIEYDKTGLIKLQTQCARSAGTTVILEKLFHTLPVRHKEFIKNLKREYHKLMHVIQSYCLISEGIKISCFNLIGDKSTKLISTHSKNSLKDNIIEIFSLSTFNSLIKFDQFEPTNEILAEYKLIKLSNENLDDQSDKESQDETMNHTNYSDFFKIEGYISSCSHGQGRSAPDRQYLYVNKRPCDHSKITKLINEVYHQFNRTQYPMFVLSIKLDSHNVDVNVTPDKLQMFFKNENILLAILKSSLVKMFERNYKTVNLNDSSFQDKSSDLLKSFFQTKSKVTQLKNIQTEEMIRNEESTKRSRDQDQDVIIESPENRNKQPRIIQNNQDSPQNEQKQPRINELLMDKTNQMAKKRLTPEKSPSTPKKLTLLSPRLNKSPFSTQDRFNMFQNHIGEKSMDNSFSKRIDMHLCNRESRMLDTPPQNKVVRIDEEAESNLSPLVVQNKVSRSENNLVAMETDLTKSQDSFGVPVTPTEPRAQSNSMYQNLKALGINSSRVDHDLADLG